MNTCEYDGATLATRSHPWTDSVENPDWRYIDFRREPARIRDSLEDLVPWADYPSIDAFYTLLEELNGEGTTLESNDCAFSGPHANDIAHHDLPLVCTGRVMVFFRDLVRNDASEVAELASRLHVHLASHDSSFRAGLIGTTLVPVSYLALPAASRADSVERALDAAKEPQAAANGVELMISFWAWGSSVRDVMEAFGRVVRNLSHALRDVGTPERPPRRERSPRP